jgi:platelet-activating factor acetylhydrolase IB subunit alpha
MRNGSGLLSLREMGGGWPAARAIRCAPKDAVMMAKAGRQSTRLWDAATGETKLDLRGHDNVVEAVAFAPSAACAAIRELAGLVSFLVLSRNTLKSVQAPSKEKSNPSHAFLASGSRDKTIKIWDGQTGQCLRTLVSHPRYLGRALTPL